MSTYNLTPDAYAAQSMATGAAVGAGIGLAFGGIMGVIQARAAMAALEQRMAEWDNPGLKYEPIRREFLLAQLGEAEKYLFTRLPDEIATLRQINIDLEKIAAEPFAVFDELKARIFTATKGLYEDASAEAFTASVDQPIPPAEIFNPTTSDLHTDFEGLELMKRQHDWLTKKTRGPVYGGSYDQDSDQREKSANAMWLELAQGKRTMEAIADRLSSENQTLADELTFVNANFRGLIALYVAAVAAYNPESGPEKVQIFADLAATISSGKAGSFGKALTAAAELAS